MQLGKTAVHKAAIARASGVVSVLLRDGGALPSVEDKKVSASRVWQPSIAMLTRHGIVL